MPSNRALVYVLSRNSVCSWVLSISLNLLSIYRPKVRVSLIDKNVSPFQIPLTVLTFYNVLRILYEFLVK